MNSEFYHIFDIAMEDHHDILNQIREWQEQIIEIAGQCVTNIRKGGKILVCGNGGSAADAQHFVAELVVRFRKNGRAIPAIALTTDTSILTACANDFGYDKVFSRQVGALCNKDDVLIALSTSGDSKNVWNALFDAKEKEAMTIFIGGDGSCHDLAELYTIFDGDAANIQEGTIVILHMIAEMIEEELRDGW